MTSHNIPIRLSIEKNHQDIIVLKTEVEVLEKNYTTYAKTNEELLTDIKTLLQIIYRDKK